ncbi:MAG: PDZ domain-containing protein [Planctomycetes bacterium]|nr:PDZ domain-containing protein [Planctomycetota bacterium]
MTQATPRRLLLALLWTSALVVSALRADIAAWSDQAWDAARRGDVAAFEAAIRACPDEGGDPVRSFRSAVDLRARNQAEAARARAEAIEKHRADLVRELDGGDITRALVAAANLKFLLDLPAWNREMDTDAFRRLEARAEEVRLKAEKETDWLLAQEMLYRLRSLHEDSSRRERFEALDDMLDASGRRVTFLAEFAPRRLHELRKLQNERFKASQTEEDRQKARARAARVRRSGEEAEDDLDEPFPEYNPAVADDWKEQFAGITAYMLREGLRKAATEHIENGGWKPLLQGGLSALTLLAQTPECRETFGGLGDDVKRTAWLAALTAARDRVDAVPDEAANAVLYREIMSGLLQANHVTIDMPETALLHEFGEGATNVIARRFEDPYSEIIWPERLRRFRQQVEGNFVGVGILIRHDEKREIMIINPLEGSPAARAGLKPGDRIVAVNGQSTTGWSLNRAVDLITGPAGEVVTLTVRREGDEKPFEMPLTRESIKMRSVVGWRKTGLDDRGMPTWDWYVDPSLGIGMVRLTSFNEDSYDDFMEAIEAMRRQRSLQGLVLDLRGNPGGLLTSATDFCNLWIPRGELVSTENRDGETTSSRKAEANRAALQDLPVVVLVNQSSASAAEILSGCLQAYDKAVVVGDRSFGKGSVQEVSPIRDRDREAAVKVTTQHYVLPPEAGKTKGRLVHKTPGSSDWGVMPDLQVRMTPEQLEKLAELRSLVDTLPESGAKPAEPRRDPDEILATGADPQLDTALAAIRARVLRSTKPTAVAEAVAAPKPASSGTQTP